MAVLFLRSKVQEGDHSSLQDAKATMLLHNTIRKVAGDETLEAEAAAAVAGALAIFNAKLYPTVEEDASKSVEIMEESSSSVGDSSSQEEALMVSSSCAILQEQGLTSVSKETEKSAKTTATDAVPIVAAPKLTWAQKVAGAAAARKK